MAIKKMLQVNNLKAYEAASLSVKISFILLIHFFDYIAVDLFSEFLKSPHRYLNSSKGFITLMSSLIEKSSSVIIFSASTHM